MFDGQPPQADRRLMRALRGEEPALGELLEHFRPHLAVLARDNLDAALAGRVSDSDVVQQT